MSSSQHKRNNQKLAATKATGHKWRIKATVVAVAASSLLIASAPTKAVYCAPFNTGIVLPVFETATTELEGAIEAVDAALAALITYQSERVISALAVLTKQKGVAANQIADTSFRVGEMTALSLNAIEQSERVRKARFDFGGEFGQGYSPCLLVANRQSISTRSSELEEERRKRIKDEIHAAPGLYDDPVTAANKAAEMHDEFCTEDQMKSGMCTTVGQHAGADINFATLFTPVMENEDLYKAKVHFVNHIVGQPDGVFPKNAGRSAATEAYVMAKSRKDALISPALNSFKEIQLYYSGINSDVPLSEKFKQEVQRYVGETEEHDQWSRVMAFQNERGLMVEVLKIAALELALQEREYRQYERMEALLASLVAQEVNTAIVNDAAGRAIRDQLEGTTVR